MCGEGVVLSFLDTRLELWFVGWLTAAVIFLLMWGLSVRREDASLVDATWSGTLGLLAVAYAWIAPGWIGHRVAMAIAVAAWSGRLTWLIARRHAAGGEEDPRYREIRERWQGRAHAFFFVFYQGQALLAALLSLPFLLAAFDPARGFHAIEIAGIALVALALAGESIADGQLARHKADPSRRGTTCRRGLWRYSRHPNYFFEWLVWCGFSLTALGAPYGWTGVVSPLVMLYLIVFVTGIPPAEARALESRGEDYRRYQEATSAFVPWFPRREEAAP